jgi:hypothetical protein
LCLRIDPPGAQMSFWVVQPSFNQRSREQQVGNALQDSFLTGVTLKIDGGEPLT